MSDARGLVERLRRMFSGGEKQRKTIYRLVNLTRAKVIATSVVLADSGGERSKGLLGREGLASGEGIWIVPCEAVHTFGMKFAIDLIYLDRQYRIRKIRSNVGPWRISVCLTAHSVVELSGGALQAGDAEVGDLLEFSPVQPIALSSEIHHHLEHR